MVMGGTTTLFLIFSSSLCFSIYPEKLTLNYVYPTTLESLVCFSENALVSYAANVQCDTIPQLHGE